MQRGKLLEAQELDDIDALAAEGEGADADTTQALVKEVRRLRIILAPSKEARVEIEKWQAKREKMREPAKPPEIVISTTAEEEMGRVSELVGLRRTVFELEVKNKEQFERIRELENARAAALGILEPKAKVWKVVVSGDVVTRAIDALRAVKS